MNVLDIDEWRMTMQIKREVVQEAIDALERYQVKRMDFDRFADEITALREALAQPEPKPIAFAGIEMWIGCNKVRHLITKEQITDERVAGLSMTNAAQKCLDALATAPEYKET